MAAKQKLMPVFFARERDADTLDTVPVTPGNGTESFICEMHPDVSVNGFGEMVKDGGPVMVDASSLEAYEFIDAQTMQQVPIGDVKERLLK